MTTIDLRPARLDYKIDRGDSFADVVTIKEGDPLAAVDVSARTYTAQIRRSQDDEAEVFDLTIDMSNAATGKVAYALDDEILADMDGGYVWDFQQAVGGSVRTLMGGLFIVYPDVTREA